MKSDGRILYTVWADVDKEVEEDWNRWCETRHIPDVMRKGGFIRARRFRVRDGPAPGRYVTIYEAEDAESLERYLAGPAKALREDYDRRYGSKGKLSRMVLEEISSFPRE